MATPNRLAEISALAGDPARAAMLTGLMDGRALTAGELARLAGVAPQTASGHLARLADAGLLVVESQGRHRYHRLASASVAQMLESIMQVAAELSPPARTLTVGPRDAALRAGRTCYDHLAGRLGVAITDAMTSRGHVELGADGGIVTASGRTALAKVGLDIAALAGGGGQRGRGRVLCRPCLDWSERRPHIAGALGAALCSLALDQGWIRRTRGSRAVAVTPKGASVLRDWLGVTAT
ncbi:MAG: winged helix-turn-helix domain-containing protein [Hyphomicrobiaceae bacterium]|nr:winged helix-turn-helix domain-containing protein [Hyphomicrobiaceae bacterium]